MALHSSSSSRTLIVFGAMSEPASRDSSAREERVHALNLKPPSKQLRLAHRLSDLRASRFFFVIFRITHFYLILFFFFSFSSSRSREDDDTCACS